MQEYLKMPFDAVREEHQIAQYLPHPLFVLYMQTSAYKQACGNIANNFIEFMLKHSEFDLSFP